MKVNVYIKRWLVRPITPEHVEKKAWLIEHAENRWCHWVDTETVLTKVYGVTLYDEQEAIMFKLKFGL